MTIVRAILIIGSAALTMAATKPATESDFRDDMLGILSKLSPGLKFKRGEDTLVLTVDAVPGGDDRTINLHRIFRYCRATTTSDTDCEAAKQEFARNISIVPPTVTPSSLRVIVRDREYVRQLDEMEKQSPERKTVALRRPIGEDLFAILASDGEKTIALVGSKDVENLKLSADQAWSLAFKQTRAVAPALPVGATMRSSPTVYQQYPYASSILAFLEDWKKIAANAGEEMFITVVSDDFVFVGSMPEGQKLEQFRQTVIEDCAAQQRCISSNVYRFRDNRWVVATNNSSL